MGFPKNQANNDRNCRQLDLLSKIAVNVKPAGSAKVAASIVLKNTIVAFGNNSMKTHPFQAKFGKNSDAIHLHAEVDAIKNALKLITVEELTRATLYICRVKYLDQTRKQIIFGLAKPCDGCFKAINNFGITKVVYSLDQEGYGVL